jgi:hypothetical protein
MLRACCPSVSPRPYLVQFMSKWTFCAILYLGFAPEQAVNQTHVIRSEIECHGPVLAGGLLTHITIRVCSAERDESLLVGDVNAANWMLGASRSLNSSPPTSSDDGRSARRTSRKA